MHKMISSKILEGMKSLYIPVIHKSNGGIIGSKAKLSCNGV